MRELTEEERRLAPEWATHYFILDVDKVFFANKESKKGLTLIMINGYGSYQPYIGCFCDDDLVEINQKPFDITKHEFSCDSFYSVELRGGMIELEGEYCVNYTLNKKDVIAMALHFGLTAEDLK